MHIYVDADACPVVDIIENKARKYKVSVTLLCDTNHVLSSAYSEVMLVGAGAAGLVNVFFSFNRFHS